MKPRVYVRADAKFPSQHGAQSAGAALDEENPSSNVSQARSRSRPGRFSIATRRARIGVALDQDASAPFPPGPVPSAPPTGRTVGRWLGTPV